MTEPLDPGTDPGTPDDETARMAVPAEPAATTPVTTDPVPAAPVTASAMPTTPTSPLTPASRADSPTPVHENEVAWATPTSRSSSVPPRPPPHS